MNLVFDLSAAYGYKSASQIARVLTEKWVKHHIYCPACGNDTLDSFPNNNPVGDFFCFNCKSEYELKSKKNALSSKIINGAYKSMIDRINSNNNPHFFFLNYLNRSLEVQNFFVIPKHYFVNDIIEKRKPLSTNAKRAGWIGCNILINDIPESGKIFFVKNSVVESRHTVFEKWNKTSFLSKQKPEVRGWTIEVLKLIESMPKNSFTLQDVYRFEPILKHIFPTNNFIKDKIRQQLQFLRDKGLIEFMGNGIYRRL